jgi:hypothetical protein
MPAAKIAGALVAVVIAVSGLGYASGSFELVGAIGKQTPQPTAQARASEAAETPGTGVAVADPSAAPSKRPATKSTPDPKSTPTAVPKVNPTLPPTRTPTPDTNGPRGGDIVLKARSGSTSLTTSTSVTLVVSPRPTDSSGVVSMAVSNTSSRPTATRAYDTSFSWTVRSGSAGTRKVYVWFKDRKGNWSSAAADTITFDNAPRDLGKHWDLSNNSNYCGTWIDFTMPGYAVSDNDGNSTVKVVRAWSEAGNYSILDSGRKVRVYNPAKPFGEQSYHFYYTAEDEHGVRVTGKVTYQVGPCS